MAGDRDDRDDRVPLLTGANHVDRGHYEVSEPAPAPARLSWRILPGDRHVLLVDGEVHPDLYYEIKEQRLPRYRRVVTLRLRNRVVTQREVSDSVAWATVNACKSRAERAATAALAGTPDSTPGGT